MLRNLLLIVSGILCLGATAQTQLPLNPKVKAGKLANGLSYYVLANSEPKERANFYIAQKVGSTLEEPNQLGLAHFLEHMAFNGTVHYPGKSMLEYLQSKGIRFGADINAYTDMDETVYNINNVPTTDKALVDSVLLVLRDWSCGLLLEDKEIEAERGVIQEEWRSRESAQMRSIRAYLNGLYEEYQYHQLPIGSMEVVMNFKPEALRDYYKKWYRPDQQGIIVVGDFDAAEMEAKVKDMFGSIEMPDNPAERVYAAVSDNKEPLFVAFEDPETQNPIARVMFKYDKLPFELRNTDMGYAQTLAELLISQMINTRLNEAAQKPECAFGYAGVGFGNFMISKTKGAFNIVVLAKVSMPEAVAQAMEITARACKAGFSESELDRAKTEILSGLENTWKERDKLKNAALAQELIRYFIDNEPDPGIEAEYEVAKSMLALYNTQILNQAAQGILTAENQAITVEQPQKEGWILPTRQQILDVVEGALNATYEAYVDEVVTDPLIAQLPAPGSVASVKDIPQLGAKEIMLSNGVRVLVKPTDFAADEINMTMLAPGGKMLYKESEAADVAMAPDVVATGKLGGFDRVKLNKYLAGKRAQLGYGIDRRTTVLQGSSTVKDLPTLFELLYATFTELDPDTAAYNANLSTYRAMLETRDKNPEAVFARHIYNALFSGNALMLPDDVATIDNANYDRMLAMVRKSLANAADYTIVMTGNIDLDSLRPLLEQYVATLPASATSKPEIVSPLNLASGVVTDDFNQPMATPYTEVYEVIIGKMPVSIENAVKMSLAGQVLSNVFTTTLREEEGGSYSPGAAGSLDPNTGDWQLIAQYKTNADMKASLMERAHKELKKLLEEGATETDFNKVREATLKQYEINSRRNSYWQNSLVLFAEGKDLVTGHREAIENLTLADFNAFLKSLAGTDNRVTVVMNGVAE